MHRRFLVTLLMCLAALPPAMACQSRMQASQARSDLCEQDLSRADTQQSKSSDRQRVGLSRKKEWPRKHEQLLSRKPEDIIPDICIGC